MNKKILIPFMGLAMIAFVGCNDMPVPEYNLPTDASPSERAGMGKFDATGNIPCAQSKGEPMRQCSYGVARGTNGTATVSVSLPNGGKRAIFFEKGIAVSADLSQADTNMDFHARKQADLFMINAGYERYEIPEAVIFGG